jgi:hypothetical protein
MSVTDPFPTHLVGTTRKALETFQTSPRFLGS